MHSTRHGFDALDRRGGNGSRNAEEDWLDDNTTASENQWSTAATTFRVSEAPFHKQRLYQDLYDWHTGKGEADRRSTILRAQAIDDAETFTNILNIPSPERQRIITIVEDLDYASDRFGGKAYEKLILAVCSLVTDKALSSGEEPSVEDRLIYDDTFEELMDNVGLDRREHNRIRAMLREKTDYF